MHDSYAIACGTLFQRLVSRKSDSPDVTRIVLLKPIGPMPDFAINFLLIEAVGQNRAGKDWDCVNRWHVPVCALTGKREKP